MAEEKLYKVEYTGAEVVTLGKAGKFMPGTSAYLREDEARAAAARGDFVVHGLDGAPAAASPPPAAVSTPAATSSPPAATSTPAATSSPTPVEKKPEAKVEEKKHEGKKHEAKPEEKKPEAKAEEKKAEEKKPEAKAEAKAP